MKILSIGDPHFKTDNVEEVTFFLKQLEHYLNQNSFDFIVVLGDLLHYHERLHTIPLNLAYDFIHLLKKFAPTFVIVGNHDMINHRQYLTTNHWMNAMKEWDNVKIVDETYSFVYQDELIIMCPFVPNGRFKDALSRIPYWNTASVIFAHQEFKGCKMGAIISEDGDEWLENDPFVISGHIHSKQQPQHNIYYPGSVMQHSFGESSDSIIATVYCNNHHIQINEHNLELPKKNILYVDVHNIEQIDPFKLQKSKLDKTKIKIKGSITEFKTFKKSSKYKELVNLGIKISYIPPKFSPKSSDIINPNYDFKKVLHEKVLKENNPYLLSDFESIIN